jgi:actin-related protein
MLCPYSLVLQVDSNTQWTVERPAMHVAIQAVISFSAFGLRSGIVMYSSDSASHAVPIFDGLASGLF